MKKTFIKWKLLSTIHDESKKDDAKDNGIIISYFLHPLTELLVKKLSDLGFKVYSKQQRTGV